MLGIKAVRASKRGYSSVTRQHLLRKLLRNPELDEAGAQDELRWIKQSLSPGTTAELTALVERRAGGEPLQYILGESVSSCMMTTSDGVGSTDFGPLTLQCRAPTLIPRPETAEIFTRLAQILLQRSDESPSRPLSILDLCTGSAPIPILLRHIMGQRVRVSGYDLSASTIALARENIALYKSDIQVHRADIMRDGFASTVISDMGGRVDLVVSNPPYITASEYRSLPSSVRDWEDSAALLGSTAPDSPGLEFYQRISKLLPDLVAGENELQEAGWAGIPRVAVEIGSGQGEQVQRIFKEGGLGRTEVLQDQYDRDRMVLGWL